MTKQLSASILSANPLNIGQTLDALVTHDITRLHFDVMDGHFVPNLAFGPNLIPAIKKDYPAAQIDCHLMVYPNDAILEAFIQAQPHSITLHAESCENITTWLDKIPSSIQKGLAIKPGPIPKIIFEQLATLDIILVMTVEPGFGGQKLLEEQISIIHTLHNERKKNHLDFSIMVDGGITRFNASEILDAGADIIVSGSDLTQPFETISEKIHTFHQILS
jgi:ribulose-phosphate 3-epimerase